MAFLSSGGAGAQEAWSTGHLNRRWLLRWADGCAGRESVRQRRRIAAGAASPALGGASMLARGTEVAGRCEALPMPLILVSLGSSFAAGPLIPPVVDEDAGRSGRNYPHLAAARLGAELVDLTVSGATTATILDEQQTTYSGKVFAPQIDGVPHDADVVTITAGGNDLDYTGSMLFAAFRRLDPEHPVSRYLAPRFPDGLQEPSEDMVRAAETGLVRIVEGVAARTVDARIVLVDYLTVIGEGPSGEAWFDAAERELFLRTRTALEGAYLRAAEQTGAELVRMSELSREHGLDSAEPWVRGLLTRPALSTGSFHPNEAGMARVAEELIGLLG